MRNKTKYFSKVLIIISLCVVSAGSFAQTKEETISWLKEKIEKNLISVYKSNGYVHLVDLKLNDITPCVITISFTTTGPGAFGTHKSQYILPTEGVRINGDGINYSSEKISYYTGGKKYYTSHTAFYFALREGEDNLRERVKKALDHLSTFCPKEKETF